MQVRAPSPALAPYVASYLGYRFEGGDPGTHAGVPSAWLTVVFSLDEPLDLTTPTPTGPARASRWSTVGGLYDRPVTIHHGGRQHGIQLELSPLGARALFGVRAGELAHQVVDLEDLVGPAGRELTERVAEAPDMAARFDVLDEVLGRLAGDPGIVRPELDAAWHAVWTGRGKRNVTALARSLGWSRRHLGEQFRAEFGLSLRTLGRISRFERAKSELVADPRQRLADLAARCDYADQAHLTREWRQFTGSSPTAWMASEDLLFVQDDAAGAV